MPMLNILPSFDILKTGGDVMSRVKDIPQQASQKATQMMTAASPDAMNLDARDLMARAANPSIGAATGASNRGSGSKSSNLSQYSILEYPSNLGSERYPHYVTFFINEYVLRGEGGRNGSSYVEGAVRNIDKYSSVGGGGLSRAIAPVAENIAQVSKKIGEQGARDLKLMESQDPQGFVDTTLNNVARSTAMGKKAIGELGAGIGAQTKRTTDAIVLYTPNQLRYQYSAGYEEFTNSSVIGSTLIAAASAGNFEDAVSNLASGGANIMSEVARGVAGGLGKAMGIEGAFDALDRLRGKIQNPRTEVLFKTIGIRKHEFNFLFSPRNQTEATLIETIIKKLKYHMHPDVQTKEDSTGNYLIMPSEFDIEFYYKTEENNRVPKILTCVLEGCAVDYTPHNMWSTFDGEPFPTHITMSLQFKELEPLNRQHIDKGF